MNIKLGVVLLLAWIGLFAPPILFGQQGPGKLIALLVSPAAKSQYGDFEKGELVAIPKALLSAIDSRRSEGSYTFLVGVNDSSVRTPFYIISSRTLNFVDLQYPNTIFEALTLSYVGKDVYLSSGVQRETFVFSLFENGSASTPLLNAEPDGGATGREKSLETKKKGNSELAEALALFTSWRTNRSQGIMFIGDKYPQDFKYLTTKNGGWTYSRETGSAEDGYLDQFYGGSSGGTAAKRTWYVKEMSSSELLDFSQGIQEYFEKNATGLNITKEKDVNGELIPIVKYFGEITLKDGTNKSVNLSVEIAFDINLVDIAVWDKKQ